MFNLISMNTPNKNDNTAVLIFVVVFWMCCCLSSIISGGALFLKSDKKDEPTASPTAASPPSDRFVPDSKLYYGGDSNLGRDGRNACDMTDGDKKYACDNDTELVGIGSGDTCGHKYYKTDKGQGNISSTDKYSKFYSCDTKAASPTVATSYFTEGVDYSIKGSREGKYCTNDDIGLICNRDVLGGWEKFQFTQVEGDIYGIKSMRSDKYCKDNKTDNMSCNNALNSHEKLTIEKHGDKYSIKGPLGNKYCSDQSGGLVCNTDHLQDWEKFTIKKVN